MELLKILVNEVFSKGVAGLGFLTNGFREMAVEKDGNKPPRLRLVPFWKSIFSCW